MNIRDAKPTDSEVIRRVHKSSIRTLGAQSYDQEQVEAWAEGCESADYTAAIESDEMEFIVAEQSDHIVGFGSLKLTAPEAYEAAAEAEITAVYIHPSVSRSGVGLQLYFELEDRALREDIASLGLTASRNAISFYEHLGFEQVTERRHEFSSHESTGVTGTVVEMVKELQA